MTKISENSKQHAFIADVSRFAVGDYGIFYNINQHKKDNGGYDLKEGNGKYWQRALVINTRKDNYGRWLADVLFDGVESRGHFQDSIEHCD